jgi:ParB family chromosome partitioning protein
MPRLDEIQSKRKNFKKRDYRPWNLEGTNTANERNNPQRPNPSQNIIQVDCGLIMNWEYNDRPLNELGNIEDLANEFKQIGQLQPCIVRPIYNHFHFKYELIVGERRWRAAQLAQVPLKVIVSDLSDSDAAIMQASENFNREDISDYARGISYAKLIDKEIITANDLIEKLGISKQQVSRLLSFNKLPTSVIEAIGDMSKVSARTAEHIKQLCAKGDEHIAVIIKMAEKIQTGEIGHSKISELVEKNISKSPSRNRESNKLYSRTGIPLITVKNSKNSTPSLHFHKDALALLEKKHIDINNLAIRFSQLIEESIGEN